MNKQSNPWHWLPNNFGVPLDFQAKQKAGEGRFLSEQIVMISLEMLLGGELFPVRGYIHSSSVTIPWAGRIESLWFPAPSIMPFLEKKSLRRGRSRVRMGPLNRDGRIPKLIISFSHISDFEFKGIILDNNVTTDINCTVVYNNLLPCSRILLRWHL